MKTRRYNFDDDNDESWVYANSMILYYNIIRTVRFACAISIYESQYTHTHTHTRDDKKNGGPVGQCV